MTALEFIRKYGWFTAKEYLAGATVFDGHSMVFTNEHELQKYVQAYNLVEANGGLTKTKQDVLIPCCFGDNDFYQECILKQAVAPVESVDECFN